VQARQTAVQAPRAPQMLVQKALLAAKQKETTKSAKPSTARPTCIFEQAAFNTGLRSSWDVPNSTLTVLGAHMQPPSPPHDWPATLSLLHAFRFRVVAVAAAVDFVSAELLPRGCDTHCSDVACHERFVEMTTCILKRLAV
jgi:hypothetical protein